MKIKFTEKTTFEKSNYVFISIIENTDILKRYFNKKEFETIVKLLGETKEDIEEPKLQEISFVKNNNAVKIIIGFIPRLFGVQDLLKLGFLYGEYIKARKINKPVIVIPEDTFGKRNYAEYTKLVLNGVINGIYVFDKFKTTKDFDCRNLEIALYSRFKTDTAKFDNVFIEIEKFADASFLVKDLVNLPANELTPERFCNIAKKELESKKCKIVAISGEDLKKEGLNLIYTVGSGSENKPALLKIYYKGDPNSDKHIAVVGKGVTFDSGGTNLKPTGHIETMKTDMAGGATALGIAKLIASLNEKINVNFYIPLVENTIGQTAYRPSDIIKSKSGKTVEILNTDAEGRLILADAIATAVEEKSDKIIDLATLTGACVVALGSFCAAFFSNSDELAEAVFDSSEYTGEDVWMLPLYKEYKKRIKSKVADIQNIATKKGEAGTIIGALFLNEFVSNTPWIHFDIAGTAYIEEKHPFYGEGASGFGLRLLHDLIRNIK
ncbi:MAG: leucyl aminopeptidase [Deferribacteraceae bacterium]|jgi:leucyl aminopeptidase|nr:leucyl aminopeptidase [Deferribacteraceae bacterium]